MASLAKEVDNKYRGLSQLLYTWHVENVYLTGLKNKWYIFPCFTVASSNNDRTVGGKTFAWRLLGMMPSISKAATVAKTYEWRSERRTRLYHSCIDILVEQINDLCWRDVFLRFGDQLFRRCRVFLDFLSMDGDEVSHATMCPTVQCPSCWCPREQLHDTDKIWIYTWYKSIIYLS